MMTLTSGDAAPSRGRTEPLMLPSGRGRYPIGQALPLATGRPSIALSGGLFNWFLVIFRACRRQATMGRARGACAPLFQFGNICIRRATPEGRSRLIARPTGEPVTILPPLIRRDAGRDATPAG